MHLDLIRAGLDDVDLQRSPAFLFMAIQKNRGTVRESLHNQAALGGNQRIALIGRDAGGQFHRIFQRLVIRQTKAQDKSTGRQI